MRIGQAFSALVFSAWTLIFCQSARAVPGTVYTVQTISDLEALGTSSSTYAVVQVQGYNSVNDGGGGTFVFTTTTVAPDSCVNFAPSAGGGTWQRQLNGSDLSVEDCGAYNNLSNATATRTAFQNAVNYVGASSNKNATIEFKGAGYLFDNTGVVIPSTLFCPRLIGGGETSTIVNYPATSASIPAFLFPSTSGARCGGGITGFTIDGNSNTVGVQLNGTNGATVSLTMSSAVSYGAVLCNCGAGIFTELNDVTINSDELGPNQQAILLEKTTGRDSYAGNRLNGYISLSSGARIKPIIQDTDASGELYNATLNINVHNLTGASNVTLIENDSSNAMYFTAGTIQLEGTNADPFRLIAGQYAYFGGTVYGWGMDRCVGILYGANIILARTLLLLTKITPGALISIVCPRHLPGHLMSRSIKANSRSSPRRTRSPFTIATIHITPALLPQ